MSSNPIVEIVLSEMPSLTRDEIDVVGQRLEKMVRDRAGRGSAAKLSNLVNIGVGTK